MMPFTPLLLVLLGLLVLLFAGGLWTEDKVTDWMRGFLSRRKKMEMPVCPELDEWRCSECSGHNRCEFEMEAGWGEYEAPDRDR